jgi:dsDNA-specific endonuclease/ATPase MutS2
MPTLRQKVDSFCKDAGAKVESTDKLRAQITQLKAELKKSKETFKNHMKQMKAASKTAKAPKAPKAPKMTVEEKGQQKREKAVVKELAKAAPKQVVAMNPVPSTMPQTATVASAGRRTRRRY